MPHAAILPSSICKKTTTSVAQISQVIAPANPKRRGMIIWNNSANSRYVSFDDVAVSASCVWIVPTFASKEYLSSVCYTGAVSAIGNAGTGTMTVWEIEE